jgi:hypothetical protein
MCTSKILHPGGIIEQKITPKSMQKITPTEHLKKTLGETPPTLLTTPALNSKQKVSSTDPFFAPIA